MTPQAIGAVVAGLSLAFVAIGAVLVGFDVADNPNLEFGGIGVGMAVVGAVGTVVGIWIIQSSEP